MVHWSIYASVIFVNIGPNNGWSPIWQQAIAGTNTELLTIQFLGTNFSEIQYGLENIF